MSESTEASIKTITDAADVEQHIREIWLKYDVDDSGVLETLEVTSIVAVAFPRMSLDEVNKLASAADINGDGDIDYEEFKDLALKFPRSFIEHDGEAFADMPPQEQHRVALKRFFAIHDKSKSDTDINALLKKVEGHEHKVWDRLCLTYGPNATLFAPPSAAARDRTEFAKKSIRTIHAEALKKFYVAMGEPEKGTDENIDKVLNAFSTYMDRLWPGMITRYGEDKVRPFIPNVEVARRKSVQLPTPPSEVQQGQQQQQQQAEKKPVAFDDDDL